FKWHIRPTASEIKEVWKNGNLSVDANVLLDLYRYNKRTRDKILESLQQFKGRIWLSDQAATEFFRNRTAAITSVEKQFTEVIEKLQSSLPTINETSNCLRKNSAIPKELTSRFSNTIDDLIAKTIDDIQKERSNHPNFLEDDQILTQLLELFDGAVGSPFDTEALKQIRLEGERRIEQQVPPGYKDAGNKTGDKRLGDFFIWKQVLDFTKRRNAPLIFVTSETKEDWWERPSGRTIGPRLELLVEAGKETNQRILIYKTEQFIKFAATESGADVETDVIDQIISLTTQRDEKKSSFKRTKQSQAVTLDRIAFAAGDSLYQSGTASMLIHRDVKVATCELKLPLQMAGHPKVFVKLLPQNLPEGCPSASASGGARNNQTINLHLRSNESGRTLPKGIYAIEFRIDITSEHNDSLDENPSDYDSSDYDSSDYDSSDYDSSDYDSSDYDSSED
ncbi:PIN domain-containing protein, partial [Akkermansiaceae bacterium]|nr:PIN domain-containing protein [Akkermansiaceae bacterium]